MKILLVDDEKQLTDALSVILKKNNYSVDCAYNGEDGLDMSLSGVYDLIVLDIMMPKIDGITILKTLRNNGFNTPILMLTAKSEITDKINGLNFGADDYLTKPFGYFIVCLHWFNPLVWISYKLFCVSYYFSSCYSRHSISSIIWTCGWSSCFIGFWVN
mgnify:CR=1 FL=1